MNPSKYFNCFQINLTVKYTQNDERILFFCFGNYLIVHKIIFYMNFWILWRLKTELCKSYWMTPTWFGPFCYSNWSNTKVVAQINQKPISYIVRSTNSIHTKENSILKISFERIFFLNRINCRIYIFKGKINISRIFYRLTMIYYFEQTFSTKFVIQTFKNPPRTPMFI